MVFLAVVDSARAAWLGEFACRREIIVDSGKVDGDLTNFPVLVRLTAVNFDFSKSMSNGFDIGFAGPDAKTALPYERERHDPDTQQAEYWVKLPFVASDSNTVFYLYYNNPGLDDGASPADVWDDYHEAVWHKSDFTSTTVADSSGNGYDGVKKAENQPAETDGKIFRAQNYISAQQTYIDTGYTNSLSADGNFTASAWLKYTGNVSYAFGQARQFGSYASDWFFPHGTPIFWMRSQTLGDTSAINDGAWHFIALSWDQTIDRYTGYIDGESIGVSGVVSGYGGVGSVKMGARPDLTSSFFNGVIDEVRLAVTARSAAWIKADYNSCNDSLLSYGEIREVCSGSVFKGL